MSKKVKKSEKSIASAEVLSVKARDYQINDLIAELITRADEAFSKISALREELSPVLSDAKVKEETWPLPIAICSLSEDLLKVFKKVEGVILATNQIRGSIQIIKK
jgi:hypothetical protein